MVRVADLLLQLILNNCKLLVSCICFQTWDRLKGHNLLAILSINSFYKKIFDCQKSSVQFEKKFIKNIKFYQKPSLAFSFLSDNFVYQRTRLDLRSLKTEKNLGTKLAKKKTISAQNNVLREEFNF